MAPEDSPCYEVKGLKRFAGLNSPTIFLPMPSSVQIQVRSKLFLVGTLARVLIVRNAAPRCFPFSRLRGLAC